MDIAILLPFIVLIGAMFLMTRSAKKKQRQAAQMRDQLTPGTGVRTIGGLYASVKEIREDTVLLEVAPGVHTLFAKNAIGAVLEDEEFERIITGAPAEDLKDDDAPVVPDDASALTGDDDHGDEGKKANLSKTASDDSAADDGDETTADAGDTAEEPAEAADADADADTDAPKPKSAKPADGETNSK